MTKQKEIAELKREIENLKTNINSSKEPAIKDGFKSRLVEVQKNKQKIENRKLLFFGIIPLIIIILLLVLIIFSLFYLTKQKTTKPTNNPNVSSNPNIVSQTEVEAIVSRVGMLIDLPKDETPTLATVLDKDKLKDQPFFANAQNGDKILIYIKAKKSIIWRPSENKIINSGPITNIDNTME